MERTILLNGFLISVIAGLAIGSAWSVLPGEAWLFVAAGFVFLAVCFYGHTRRAIFIYAAGLLLGVIWSVHHGHQLFEQRVPDALAKTDWVVEGVVLNQPEGDWRRARFDFKVEEVIVHPQAIKNKEEINKIKLDKLRLNFYVKKNKRMDVKPGQRWRLKVRLKPPRGSVNEYGFDYESWLLREGYSATGYVRDELKPLKLPSFKYTFSVLSLKVCFDSLAYELQQWIEQEVAQPYQSIFSALLMGNKDSFTRSMWETLKQSGTIHLVVVSGLHIGLMAWVGYGLLSLLSRLLFFPLLFAPAQIWGAIGSFIVAAAYAGLSGFSLPAQRALIMLACALFGIVLRKQVQTSAIYLMAMLMVLLWDPLALYSASFWLSFGAVGVLLYVFSARTKQKEKWFVLRAWLHTQWAVSLALLPLLAYWMGSVPWVMPIANLLAVPWVSFVVMPAVMLSKPLTVFLPAYQAEILSVSEFVIDGLWEWLTWCEQINTMWFFPVSDLISLMMIGKVLVVLACLGIAVALAPKALFVNRVYQYGLGVLLCVPILVPWQKTIPPGEFVLTQLDVGQGLSVLIETHSGVTVYDVGNRYSDDFDIGRDVVAEQIRRKGYTKIDTLVISHSDSDHAGGLAGLLGEIPADKILSGSVKKLTQKLAKETPHKMRACYAGQEWKQDGVNFQMLSPEKSRVYKKTNSQSCVLKISNNKNSVLLTGDIPAEQERWLLRQHEHTNEQLNNDILLVPHHGSKSSSTAGFIRAVNPQQAVISVGYKSRYGHPHPSVLARYKKQSILVWRSDLHGALRLSSEDGFSAVRAARLESGRYWHHW